MRLRVAFTSLSVLALVPGTGAGQVVSLAPPRLEVGARGRSTWEAGARGLAGEQWLGVGLQGAVLDPGLLSFNATLTPSVIQNRLEGGFGVGSSDGRRLGLDFQVHALRRRALWGTARIARFAFDERGSGLYEGESSTRIALGDAAVRHENRLMPLQLGYHQESWRAGAAEEAGVTAPASTFESLELSGANRKTSFSLRQQINRNGGRTVTRTGDFQNRQSWGKGSSLQIGAVAVGQSDSAGRSTTQVILSGGVHLQHLRNLASDWAGFRQTTGAGDLGSTNVGLTAGIGWTIRPDVAVGLTGTRTVVDFAEGSERSFRVGPNAGIGVRLPLGARLSTSGSLAYQRHWTEVSETARLVVVGERHVVDAGGAFLLDRPSVDPGTLVVRSPDGIVYTPGLDYEVIEVGGYAQVLALPGGRLAPGQAVQVDYQHRPIDRPDVPSWWVEYAADLQVRGLRAYHRRWAIEPTGTPAPDVLAGRVRDQDHWTVGAQLVLPGRALTTILRVERHHRQDDRFLVDLTTLGASVNARPAPRLGIALGGDHSATDGTTGPLRQINLRSQVNWIPAPTLSVGAGLTSWNSRERHEARRTRFGGTMQLAWQPGLLRAAIYYAYLDWSFRALRDGSVAPGPPTSHPQHRLTLEISRRF